MCRLLNKVSMLVVVFYLHLYTVRKQMINWWLFWFSLEWLIFMDVCVRERMCACVCVNLKMHLDNLLCILTSGFQIWVFIKFFCIVLKLW